jgi:hypothetical protein
MRYLLISLKLIFYIIFLLFLLGFIICLVDYFFDVVAYNTDATLLWKLLVCTIISFALARAVAAIYDNRYDEVDY